MRRARLNLAAEFARLFEQRDPMAALGRGRRHTARPAGPDPTTAIRFAPGRRGASNSISRQARGLTRQVAMRSEKMRSRHAWLQAMQALISSARPCRALSRRNPGRPAAAAPSRRDRRRPSASIASATSGVLMRFEAMTGIAHRLASDAATAKPKPRAAPLGDGRHRAPRASRCPVLSMSAPAA